MLPSPLSRLRVVLLEPSHPGNIGAAARAMANMGLERLILVAPRCALGAEARALAAAGAPLLQRAELVPDLDAAVSGCRLLIGASARLRHLAWPQWSPREAAAHAIAEASHGEVALLFGREDCGLSNAELQRCHAQLSIPSDACCPSLNLAMAVLLVSYELRLVALAAVAPPPAAPLEDAATAEQIADFHRHLEQTLAQIGFLNPAAPRQLLARLRRLFARTRLDSVEIGILRGVLSAVQRAAGSAPRSGEPPVQA